MAAIFGLPIIAAFLSVLGATPLAIATIAWIMPLGFMLDTIGKR